MCPLLGFEGLVANKVAARPRSQGCIAQCIINGLENNYYYSPKCGTAQIAYTGNSFENGSIAIIYIFALYSILSS